MTVERTASIINLLTKKGISYEEKDLRTELKNQGIGTEWIDAYTRRLRNGS